MKTIGMIVGFPFRLFIAGGVLIVGFLFLPNRYKEVARDAKDILMGRG
jgi:hypothetical protein